MIKMLRQAAFKAAVLLTIFSIPMVASAVTIDKIIVFGDSLSDNGNLYSIATKAHATIPGVPVIPKNPPYYEGRFTNGPVWVESLAKNLNVPLSDYAYGGSWSESFPDSGLFVPFSLSMQVDFYLVYSATDLHKDQHLYVIWSGSNDYLAGRDDADYATTNTVSNIQNQIEWLVYYGAKYFLVLGVPDLGVIPASVDMGQTFAAGETKLSEMHNDKLAKMVEKESSDHPDTIIAFGDVNKYFREIIKNPESYHLKNVKDACFGGTYTYALRAGMIKANEVQAAKLAHIDIANNPDLRTVYIASRLAEDGEKACANPDEYVFWDHVHPSRVIHQVIAQTVQTQLQAAGIQAN